MGGYSSSYMWVKNNRLVAIFSNRVVWWLLASEGQMDFTPKVCIVITWLLLSESDVILASSLLIIWAILMKMRKVKFSWCQVGQVRGILCLVVLVLFLGEL